MTAQARPRTLEIGKLAALEAWLSTALNANSVTLGDTELLGGGAIQENWRISVVVDGGSYAGEHVWVLRTDAAAVISVSLDRASEYAVLEAAHSGGVKVAQPIARCADTNIIGAQFMIQAFIEGNAQARRIVRDPALSEFGPPLAAELGRALAGVHCIGSRDVTIAALPVPIGNAAKIEVGKLRQAVASAAEPRPTLAYVLGWLDRKAPQTHGDFSLVHGDYRTGNYLIDNGRLMAILDWEFSHWGDPDEDIGWFCAKCWRFGNVSNEAGGIAPRAAFIEAYEAAAGRKVDSLRIHYWETMAAAKWATIALLQGDRFRRGGEMSVELALTGLMVSELELEALDNIHAIEAVAGH